MTEKQIPFLDEKIERLVVASIVATKGKNLVDVFKVIQPTDLWHKEPRDVFAKILELEKKGEPIDLLSVENSGLLHVWLPDSMGESVGRSGAIGVWAQKIREASQKRQIVHAVNKLQEKISDKELSQVVKELADTVALADKPLDKQFQVFSYNDLIKEDLGKTPFVVHKLIPGEGITIISGPPASFKTFILMDMIIKIAKGERVWGVFETEQTPVLIMDEESGKRILQTRFRALQNDNPEENLPIYMSSYSNLSFTETESILNFCLEKGIKMVCFDSFVRFLGAVDENSSTDIKQVFQRLKLFCAAGIAVVLIHHHRKSIGFDKSASSELRGSSDILAAAHSHVVFERNTKDSTIIVRQNKLREEQERNPFVLGIEADPSGTISFSYRGDLDENKNSMDKASDAIIAVMGTEQLTTKEIQEYVKQSSGAGGKACAMAIKALVEDGRLTKIKGSGPVSDKYLLTAQESEEELDKDILVENVFAN